MINLFNIDGSEKRKKMDDQEFSANWKRNIIFKFGGDPPTSWEAEVDIIKRANFMKSHSIFKFSIFFLIIKNPNDCYRT